MKFLNSLVAFFSTYRCLRNGKMRFVEDRTWRSDLEKSCPPFQKKGIKEKPGFAQKIEK